MLVPAFVDIHMHGAAGVDVGQCDADGLMKIAAVLASHGTGGFLPTMVSASPACTRHALSVIAEVMERQRTAFEFLVSGGEQSISLFGAFVLGAHLEGPFLLPAYKGAMDESAFLEATLENWHELTGEYEHLVRRVTLDPLCPGALELIPYLTGRGITVTLGHTAASCETVEAAFSAGATSVTHIFNAMAPLHHRAPGPIGAALASDDTYAELICDFLHVDKHVCKAVIKAKTPYRTAVITDSCEAAGMPDGPYTLCGRSISVVNGEARLPDGRLASSTVFMDRERLNLMSVGFGERDVALLTHHTPLDCIRATAAERKLFSGLYAELGPDGLGCGLTFQLS